MPKKYSKKRTLASSRKNTRRKLPISPAIAVTAGLVGRSIYNTVKKRQKVATLAHHKKALSSARWNKARRLEGSDNITTASPIVIGKQREPSFQEKVALALRPALTFKRNYQFSSESQSGRKGMFAMTINSMTSDDLLTDITLYKGQLTTDGITADVTFGGNAYGDNAQFYIDYHKESIKMVNSSSNSLTGKITLYAHKRDTDTAYDNALINPINLMMYYSSNARPLSTTGIGGEQIVGNGWNFNTAVGVTNYSGVYNMPGSSLNPAGYTASMDPTLSPTSSFISDRVGFWFSKVGSSTPFSLKPGQQFNSSYVFNLENNKLRRELAEFTHIAGVSYCLVVEFQGGIIGDSTVNNVISTGTTQISVIRDSLRSLGIENKLRPKIVLQTAPLTTIADANQIIINNDTGITDIGVDLDP